MTVATAPERWAPEKRATQQGATSEGALRFAQAAALLTVLLISSRQFLGEGVTLGHIATLLVAPLWIPALRRWTGGLWLAGIGIAATIASVWLTVLASADHTTTLNNTVSNTLLITGHIAAIPVLFWARELLPLWLIGLTYGVGMLISAYTRHDDFAVNAWKFALAVPVAIITLSLARRTGQRWLEVVVLLLLAAASARLDSRSDFGEFVIAALLAVWQILPRPKGRRGGALRIVMLFAVIAVAVYNVGTQLLVDGALGTETQQRSIAQIDRAGSIIVGGRPEMGATAARFLNRPAGFGGGTIATTNDINVAKTGMEAVHYDPNNGYVENFLFGSKFELHSMTGDLWAYAGFAGIALAVLGIVLLLVVVGRGVAARRIDGVVLFAVVYSFWNFFFNPLYTSVPVLVLALGLGLSLRTKRGETALVAPAPAAALPSLG